MDRDANIVMLMLCPACQCPREAVAPAWRFTPVICPVAAAQSVKRRTKAGMRLPRKWTTSGSCPSRAVGHTARIWGSARTLSCQRRLLLAKSLGSARLRRL
ncbi:uncharacterized protein LOC144623231 [Crassostrea virginica]